VLDLDNGGAGWLKIWDEELPWEIKVEGCASYPQEWPLERKVPHIPPMVSRSFVYIAGVLWHPLYNLSRCVKRLVCAEKREDAMEWALIEGACTTLALQMWWYKRRWYYSPVCEFLDREFVRKRKVDPRVIDARAANCYRHTFQQLEPGDDIPINYRLYS